MARETPVLTLILSALLALVTPVWASENRELTEKEAFIEMFSSLELETKEKSKYYDKPECCRW